MIIARAPFRISFVGGGSDLPSFYRRGYGAIVSATINKYMYIVVHPYFHERILVKYSRTEDVRATSEIRHPIVREVLEMLEVVSGIEITSIADVPAGTGLGSSSAFTVALLHAIHAFKGEAVSRRILAEEACRIEIDRLKEPIGKQDQYASAYGGLNYIRFGSDESVSVESLACDQAYMKALEERLLIYYLGTVRAASTILARQNEKMTMPETYHLTEEMVRLAEECRVRILKRSLSGLGELLHEGWEVKKRLVDGITNGDIDSWYNLAREAGVSGGKLLGAGGGGFLLLYCEPSKQANVRRALSKLRETKVRFEFTGCTLHEL